MQLERMPTRQEEELARGFDGVLQSESSPWIQSLPLIHSRRRRLLLLYIHRRDLFGFRFAR